MTENSRDRVGELGQSKTISSPAESSKSQEQRPGGKQAARKLCSGPREMMFFIGKEPTGRSSSDLLRS